MSSITPQEVLRRGWAEIVRETPSERERRTQRALFRFEHERRAKRRLIPRLVFAVVVSAVVSTIGFVIGRSKTPEPITSDRPRATVTAIATAIATATATTTSSAPPVRETASTSLRPSPAPSSMALLPSPSPSSTTSSSAAPSVADRPRPTDPWSEIQSALSRGERRTAERELDALLQSIGPSHPRFEQASFLLAELELARSEVVGARGRLQPLMHSNDPQMAEDAASLLARSFPSALDRSEIWTRYLATQPPSPRRERALLERARAFERAGRPVSARADVLTLCKTAKRAGLVVDECEAH